MKKILLVDIQPVITILVEQLRTKSSNLSDLKRIINIIENLNENEEIDPNFQGTIDELKVYATTLLEASNLSEHIKLNDLNIKRWIEELNSIMKGSEAITIDYEQRKGREI